MSNELPYPLRLSTSHDLALTIEFADAQGPIDMTGWTHRFAARWSVTDAQPSFLADTAGGGIVAPQAAQGRASARIPRATLAAALGAEIERVGAYEWIATAPGGAATRLLFGPLSLELGPGR